MYSNELNLWRFEAWLKTSKCKTYFDQSYSSLFQSTFSILVLSLLGYKPLSLYLQGLLRPVMKMYYPMARASMWQLTAYSGFANFTDKWSHCDFCYTNFGVILEYLESSITTKKAIFRLSSTWSWHVYTIVRDTRSSCFVVQYNSIILI